jgi:hypothetical protein
MISPTHFRVYEYRYQDLLAAVTRARLVNESGEATPAVSRPTGAGRFRAFTRRAIAALAAVHIFGVGRVAEA